MPENLTTLRRVKIQARSNPMSVLREARADAAAGRHDLAAIKHYWFHRNASAFDLSRYNERLSSALEDWVKVARAYPPAMTQLLEIREQAEQRLRMHKAGSENFVEFEAINRYLGEPERTIQAFKWLDKHHRLIAKRVFDVAVPALVEAREYDLCLKYVRPRAAIANAAADLREVRALPAKDPGAAELKALAETRFARLAATMVAFMVMDDQLRFAKFVAQRAINQSKSPLIEKLMDKALRGKIPE